MSEQELRQIQVDDEDNLMTNLEEETRSEESFDVENNLDDDEATSETEERRSKKPNQSIEKDDLAEISKKNKSEVEKLKIED